MLSYLDRLTMTFPEGTIVYQRKTTGQIRVREDTVIDDSTHRSYTAANRGTERKGNKEYKKEDDLDVHLTLNRGPFDWRSPTKTL